MNVPWVLKFKEGSLIKGPTTGSSGSSRLPTSDEKFVLFVFHLPKAMYNSSDSYGLYHQFKMKDEILKGE